MLNQIKKNNEVFNKVFHPTTVLKARQVYEYYTDKYLGELQEAVKNGDSSLQLELKMKLKQLSQNLSEIEHFEVPNFSYQEVIQLTAPVRREDIEKKMALKAKVFNKKNVETALQYYYSYIDINLDNLNVALKQEDVKRVEAIKSELEALRKNVADLKLEGIA